MATEDMVELHHLDLLLLEEEDTVAVLTKEDMVASNKIMLFDTFVDLNTDRCYCR